MNASLDQFYTYNVTAIGNPDPTFSLDLSPTGMSINSETGEISWQPVPGHVGDHDLIVLANNRVGVDEQIFTIAVAADTIPPTAPTALQVDAVTTTSVDVSWIPASDTIGVDHYTILKTRRCGFRHSRTCYVLVKGHISQTRATVIGLAPYPGLSYVVRAVDAAGNSSGNSNKISFQTLSEPTGLQYRFDGRAGAFISGPAKSPL